MRPSMARRNILICFDAFGTLFKPKYPVTQQYGDVARSLGIDGFTDEALEQSFRAAFKRETKLNPNYGKASNMNASQWWTSIIYNAFQPLAGSQHKIKSELAPRLIEIFASDEGYSLFPDVVPLLRQLPRHIHGGDTRIVVGVITNSDDRVPDVLSALGLRVSPDRYGKMQTNQPRDNDHFDVDFSVMSYDVGHTKPDKRIFAAAEEMVRLTARADEGDLSSWDKIYIGDEYENDIAGAVNAGWNAVFIDRETPGKRSEVSWLDDESPGSLLDVFKSSKAVGFSSLAKLAEWLPKAPSS